MAVDGSIIERTFFSKNLFTRYRHGVTQMPNDPMKTTTIRLPEELFEQAVELAEATGRTFSGLCRYLLGAAVRPGGDGYQEYPEAPFTLPPAY